ncbi:hypothetical protein EVG20_g5813 [Dentipellis fragilis]|uniref:Uncharacterized protein n=1 Tax=Dentipellis fragilis TaxID=205917 RepID=A0A4Y9YUR8_9AGAM|nr:hypothetical protein EVG20_g5813 [Dentipellis fragilis]
MSLGLSVCINDRVMASPVHHVPCGAFLQIGQTPDAQRPPPSSPSGHVLPGRRRPSISLGDGTDTVSDHDDPALLDADRQRALTESRGFPVRPRNVSSGIYLDAACGFPRMEWMPTLHAASGEARAPQVSTTQLACNWNVVAPHMHILLARCLSESPLLCSAAGSGRRSALGGRHALLPCAASRPPTYAHTQTDRSQAVSPPRIHSYACPSTARASLLIATTHCRRAMWTVRMWRARIRGWIQSASCRTSIPGDLGSPRLPRASQTLRPESLGEPNHPAFPSSAEAALLLL